MRIRYTLCWFTPKPSAKLVLQTLKEMSTKYAKSCKLCANCTNFCIEPLQNFFYQLSVKNSNNYAHLCTSVQIMPISGKKLLALHPRKIEVSPYWWACPKGACRYADIQKQTHVLTFPHQCNWWTYACAGVNDIRLLVPIDGDHQQNSSTPHTHLLNGHSTCYKW